MGFRLWTRHAVAVAIVVASFAAIARPEVVRVEIGRREPFADGHAFGAVGEYERITGRLHFEVDPAHPANAGIVDLKLAPRNSAGRVEFSADFFLL